ncbi:MAG: hypothetical protein HY958_09990 [Bacteroidia bacterium]|nr:hypothetical protein [Bacteroidia bacterium]
MSPQRRHTSYLVPLFLLRLCPAAQVYDLPHIHIFGIQPRVVGGYHYPWNGTYNGNDAPTGSYIFIINLSNGSAPINGIVTLIR